VVTKGRVSIISPCRNERFLSKTVADLLAKSAGDIEVIPVLDGCAPPADLPTDPRVKPLQLPDRVGMRGAIDIGALAATGEFLMKTDGHCMYAEGFDQVLKADCEDNWIVIPRRYSLEPEEWKINPKEPVDAHYLSWPFERPGDKSCGLHGNIWRERAKACKDVLVDDEMSSQGSCWFMMARHKARLGHMEVENYGTFCQEFQELGMKTWLGGGRVVVNKKTWYAHLHKGKKYGTGYQFNNAEWKKWIIDNERGRLFTIRHWMFDEWAERKRDLKSLIDRFWPVPGWPADWEKQRWEFKKELKPILGETKAPWNDVSTSELA